MSPNSVFYYPYADFKDRNLPMLKAAALYFDKLYILDPFKAVSGSNEFNDLPVARDVQQLEQEKILVRVSPEEVLGKYENNIAEAIHDDLQDPEFLRVCEQNEDPRKRWILALAKVPRSIQLDASMQKLMGPLPNSLYPLLHSRYRELPGRYYEEGPYVEHSMFQTNGERIEYRYREFPLPLGESIMINHALFGGLLQKGATPLTDEPFHRDVLNLKIQRAIRRPQIRMVLEDQAKKLQLKQNIFSSSLMTDWKIKLPALSPKLSLASILEYRHEHESELQEARLRLSQISREINENPWSDDFAKQVDAKLGETEHELHDLQKQRDDWLKKRSGKTALKAAGILAGAGGATLSLMLSPTPLMPVLLCLSLIGGVVVPGLEIYREWIDKKEELANNGLHYFINW